MQEGSVLLSRSFKNDSESLLDDLLASFAYVQEVYTASLSEIHGAYLSSSLCTLLSRRAGVPVIISPLFPELSPDQEVYRDAVAAAFQECVAAILVSLTVGEISLGRHVAIGLKKIVEPF